MLHPPNVEALAERLQRTLIAVCPHCGGKGFVSPPDDDTLEPWDSFPTPCVCREELARRCALLDGNVPPEFWGVATADLIETRALKKVREYAANLRRDLETGLGLLMVGPNGTGKTASAVLVLIEALRADLSIGFLTARDYVSTAYTRDETISEWRGRLACAKVLVIDELGKEHRAKDSEHAISELDDLLRWRRGRMLPTLIATNYDADQIRSAYGESIWSILQDRFDWVPFSGAGGDFRLKARRTRGAT